MNIIGINLRFFVRIRRFKTSLFSSHFTYYFDPVLISAVNLFLVNIKIKISEK